jgi:hypothetical protein
MNKNLLYQELIKNQRKNLSNDRKLGLYDLKRISSYLNKSIFVEECSLWDGYITEIKNSTSFVNFFYNGKKQALHRLLYYNFVDDVSDNEYLKFSCENKGKCCCIKHILKLKKNEKKTIEKPNMSENNTENNTENNDSETSTVKKKITVEF